MTDQRVVIGELTFVIDQSVGTQAERDEFYNELINFSLIPTFRNSLQGLTQQLSNSEVSVAVSSDVGDLLVRDSEGSPIYIDGQLQYATVGTTQVERNQGDHILRYAKIYLNLEYLKTAGYVADNGTFADHTVGSMFTNELGGIVGLTNQNFIPKGMLDNPLYLANSEDMPAAEDRYTGYYEDIYHRLMGEPERGGEDHGDALTNRPVHDIYADIDDWITAKAKSIFYDTLNVNTEHDTSLNNYDNLLEASLDFAKWVDSVENDHPVAYSVTRLYFPVVTFVLDIIDLFNLAFTRGSPLVLDLDGDGIELTSLSSTAAVYWDIDQDGYREASGWVTGGDGLLAIDKNADGVINDNGELFGNSATVANGFDALAVYDTNADGAITAADAAFSLLKVWVDTNGNGYSESGELHTLTDLGITSITTTYTDTAIANNGNMIEETSSFVQNGTTKSIVDAWFAYDSVNTVYNGDYTLDVRTLFMPTLRGYGTIADLHIAMSLSNTGAGNLLDKVAALQSKTFARVFGAANDNKIAELFTARCLVQRVAA